MEIREIGIDEWGAALPSTGFEVFHDPDALAVLAEYTDAELRLFAGYKGQQAVALVPVFVNEHPVGRTVFSPPLSLGVPRLGPVVDPISPKRRKAERINRELAEHVVEECGVHRRTTLFRMVCPVTYADPRPYGWNGLAVEPEFTYVVDLEDTTLEDVMAQFSRSLRNEMRRLEELDIRIETEGVRAALRVYDDVVERYDERDASAPMSRAFVRDLLTRLDDDRWRVYVARDPDGEYVSGIIVLFSNDLAYYWQGGVVATRGNVSVNNVLQRTILSDLLNDPELDSITGYDLVGANTERLCEYKGKFNGSLGTYYVVESSTTEMSLAKSAYRRLGKSLNKG